MKALAGNEISLDRFKIKTETFAMDTSTDYMTEQVLNSFSQVIRNLTHLDLRMDDEEVSVANMRKLAKVIAVSPNSPNLSSLHIGCAYVSSDTEQGCASPFQENEMAAVLLSENLPHLEHLNIYGGFVQLPPLVQFAKKHKTLRLRQLDLSWVRLEAHGLDDLPYGNRAPMARKLIGLPGTDVESALESNPF